jgi:hypothetical protein
MEAKPMEIVAHGLWTAAAAVVANRCGGAGLRTGRAVWWGMFPDVLAFGPGIAVGAWLRLAHGPEAGHALPHAHFGLPLYPAAHSLVVCLPLLALAALLSRRTAAGMLGWLLHILIDIPTHSLRYYATRFLWPLSDFRIDGIAWWTPWFWGATYAALAAVYLALWRAGWLRTPAPPDGPAA